MIQAFSIECLGLFNPHVRGDRDASMLRGCLSLYCKLQQQTVAADRSTISHRISLAQHRDRQASRHHKGDRICPLCNYRVVNPGLDAAQSDSFDFDDEAADPIEGEHHAIFACSGYAYARQLFQDLSNESISSVGLFLGQPNCNRVANFLTWIRHMHLDLQPL